MAFELCFGPSHQVCCLPIRAFNPDGSIELFDGRNFRHSPQVGILYEYRGTQFENAELHPEPPGTRYHIDVVPPRVQVRDDNGCLQDEYRFRGGNWYWNISLAMKLGILWQNCSPFSFSRRYGV